MRSAYRDLIMGQNNDTREHGDAQGHQGGYPRKAPNEVPERKSTKPGLPEENIAGGKEGLKKDTSGADRSDD